MEDKETTAIPSIMAKAAEKFAADLEVYKVRQLASILNQKASLIQEIQGLDDEARKVESLTVIPNDGRVGRSY